MIAGGEAITQLLSIISYHLLDNPTALARLQEELHTAMPDTNTPVTWNDLEKLPYLVGFVPVACSHCSSTDEQFSSLLSSKRVCESRPL